ncbi:MAG: hypothetical protein COW03_05785 [Cytophagales bacterium CG12_big_fil_rev_8_21_14_0_65_40_12]|nr:MAG: hypothetical protein COW03_05785 [Cytophagales bacterium CG12_big_fil_rev_8_21_14_0_65_40_12]PIW03241.1 MAG: hypothetical protein COW40_16030 [Cytophagales bacterium CG17_big_fil_post_rev_8_21_14_2_50_40_13]
MNALLAMNWPFEMMKTQKLLAFIFLLCVCCACDDPGIESKVTKTIEKEFLINNLPQTSLVNEAVQFDLFNEEFIDYREGLQEIWINSIDLKIENQSFLRSSGIMIEDLSIKLGRAFNQQIDFLSKTEREKLEEKFLRFLQGSSDSIRIYTKDSNDGVLNNESEGIRNLSAWINKEGYFVASLEALIQNSALSGSESITFLFSVNLTALVKLE